jgi:hypothetical protein
MTDLTTRSDCPTDEILAAFVAGGLDDRARVVPFRLRRWRLAAIAALITFVIACGDLVSRRDAQDPVSPMPTLAAVAPPERLLEVRLSSLEWRPLAEVRRDAGIDLPLALRAEVERLRELAENEPTPENLHASAAAWLAAGNPAKAIVVIEQVPLQELSETALSDYAAALVAEGRRSGWRRPSLFSTRHSPGSARGERRGRGSDGPRISNRTRRATGQRKRAAASHGSTRPNELEPVEKLRMRNR